MAVVVLALGGAGLFYILNENKGSSIETVIAADEEDESITNEEPKEKKSETKLVESIMPTNNSVPIAELEEKALHSVEVSQKDKQAMLYIVPAQNSEPRILKDDGGTYLGLKEDIIYEGNLEFYLADINGKAGYRQEEFADSYLLNLSNKPFATYPLNDRTLITILEPATSNTVEFSFWTYSAGRIQPIKIGESNRLTASSRKVKIIDGQYIQLYNYLNGEPFGWTYDTYRWDPWRNELLHHDEMELLIDEEDEWFPSEDAFDFYKNIADEWNSRDEYYMTFPHIKLPKDLAKRLAQGYILDEKAPVGSSLIQLMKRRTDHDGLYDVEGGQYYSYSNGEMYFNDSWDDDDTIYTIGLQQSILTTKSELQKLLGDPDSHEISEYEEYPSTLMYELNNYHVIVHYREEQIESILLSRPW